jgi:hypothetical protein
MIEKDLFVKIVKPASHGFVAKNKGNHVTPGKASVWDHVMQGEASDGDHVMQDKAIVVVVTCLST